MTVECTKSGIRDIDILCGKGKYCTDHIGSIAYKAILETRLPQYMNPNAESCDKTFMTVEMITMVMSEGGRFMREKKKGSGIWVELCKTAAREKVRDGFRDAVKSCRKKKSSANTGPTFLTRIGFSIPVTKDTTFAELVVKISEDPSMTKFLVKSKQRQEAMEQTQRRRNSSLAARSSLLSSSTSSLRETNADTGLYAPSLCSSSDMSSLAPIMPVSFVPVPLPHHQGLLPLAALQAAATSVNTTNYTCDPTQKLNKSSTPQTYCTATPLTLSYGDSLSMAIDDPWGEGDFEEEADPSGGDDLLESLERADKLIEASGLPDPATSSTNDEDCDDDEDWLNNLDALIDDVRDDIGSVALTHI